VYTPTYPILTSFDSVLQAAATVIRNNTVTIKDDTIDYLVKKYASNFTYNEATCFRDIGYIVDGSAIDLLTGGNYQSVNAGKSYYRNSSARLAITTQLTETVDGITFARSLGQQVLNKTVANRYQTQYVQVIGSLAPSTAAKNTFTSNYNIILDIIKSGYGVAPTASFGTGIYSITFNNGGNGFVEDFPLAKIFRHSPLNSVWEGSGNVICLDVLRGSNSIPILMDEIALARGMDKAFDAYFENLRKFVKHLLIGLSRQLENKVAKLACSWATGTIIVRQSTYRPCSSACRPWKN
jgi:hypothetical protein